jgi:hypothetical protein
MVQWAEYRHLSIRKGAMPSVRGPVVKTTISMAESLHKWLKIYGVQHDLSLQDMFDEALLTVSDFSPPQAAPFQRQW